MDARIIAVNHAKGIIATYWEFDFELANGNGNGKEFEGTISLDEAVQFANRPDLGPVADMCRAIKSTPPVEFIWLVGRIFTTKS
jgi:hypothetical protein